MEHIGLFLELLLQGISNLFMNMEMNNGINGVKKTGNYNNQPLFILIKAININ